MKFETLLFIGRLLKQEEETTRLNYVKSRDYLNSLYALLDVQESDQLREKITEAKDHRDTLDRIHNKALRALEDFSEHEWR